MINFNSDNLCCGCYACHDICPKRCISMVNNGGFQYPIVNTNKCIDCKLCERVCPALNPPTQLSKPDSTYAIQTKNLNLRHLSSSGGLCHIIAEKFIIDGGIVVGVELAKKTLEVNHIIVKNKIDLDLIRNSKYLQSNMSGIYLEIKKYLDSGTKVLFIGTPCQVSALKLFLRKKYKNLFSIDFICHGVPSRDIFQQLIEHLEKKHSSKISFLNFREKKPNWREFCTHIQFDNGKSIDIPHNRSLFFRGFMSNLYLRPSCYNCHFNNHKSSADLTVGDLWGVEFINPSIDDNTGLNLAIARTKEGEQILTDLSKKLNISKYSYNNALRFNPAIENPPHRHPLYVPFKLLNHIIPFYLNIWSCLAVGSLTRKLKLTK